MVRIAATLRAATAADAGPIGDVFLAARRTAMPWLPAIHTDGETRAWIAAFVVPRTEVRVALVDGRVAGFLAREGDMVAHLYVAPRHQGVGIGGALLGEAQAAGRALSLHVFERNAAARRFYTGHGFVVAERHDGSGNEEGLPDLVMTWTPPRP